MRKRLNLDMTSFDSGMILIHSGYAMGKTFLSGDFLKHESQTGPVRFINVKGEDGYMSLSSFGLGEVGETVETYEDLEEVIQEYRKSPLQALAVDSLKPLARLVMMHEFGEDRLPKIEKNGPNEWGTFHFSIQGLVAKLRACAKFVLCTCPSDKSVNQLDKQTYITPDLPGRGAIESTGWFDIVGYLTVVPLGPGKFKRVLKVSPNAEIAVRQRLRKPIVNDIILPEGPGGWGLIKSTIMEAMKE